MLLFIVDSWKVTLLMETGLLHDFLGIFEKYYFCMEGSTQDEIEPCKVRLNIEMNIKMNIPARGEHGLEGGSWGGGPVGVRV